MRFDLQLLNGYRPLFVVFDLWVLALVVLVRPMVQNHGDDQGDGLALVLLPAPKMPRLGRTFAFIATFLALVVVYHAYQGPFAPDILYAKALRRVANWLVLAPAEVNGFLADFTLGLRMLVLATMVSLVLTCRATPLRRVSMLVQTCWYVAAVFLFDCLLIVVLGGVGPRVGPGTTSATGSRSASGSSAWPGSCTRTSCCRDRRSCHSCATPACKTPCCWWRRPSSGCA